MNKVSGDNEYQVLFSRNQNNSPTKGYSWISNSRSGYHDILVHRIRWEFIWSCKLGFTTYLDFRLKRWLDGKFGVSQVGKVAVLKQAPNNGALSRYWQIETTRTSSILKKSLEGNCCKTSFKLRARQGRMMSAKFVLVTVVCGSYGCGLSHGCNWKFASPLHCPQYCQPHRIYFPRPCN